MAELDKRFSGSIPAIYHTHLGPLLFEPYAQDLARRLAGFEGEMLETAAGTGIATRAVVENLSGRISITATDLNQAMLDHAARMLDAPQVTWRQANADSLPFENGSFDAVICQFGVMFFPDKVAAYSETRRVLRPGGRFVFSVWDRLEENPLAAIVHQAVVDAFPEDPPLFLARAPYGYHDTGRIARDLREAGFAAVEMETVTADGRAPSATDPAKGFCQGSPLRLEIEARDPQRLEEVTARAAEAVARSFGHENIVGKLQAHVVVARR
jgi:ubiquinone/menaquinone biosynthesis C-methylase UbiE